MSVIRTAVKNPVTTALIFIACMIFGIFSLAKTSIALFPDFDSNVIMVMSSYQGANAEDIEQNLTKVLENTLNGVEHLKKLNTQRISVTLFMYSKMLSTRCGVKCRLMVPTRVSLR